MSLLCAAAPSLGTLLVARGLQGVGAAAMIPASLAVVLFDTPPERRAAAIGAWSAAGALAAAAGPAISGVLVDLEGWRSLFVINVPFGLAILAGSRAIPAGGIADGDLPDAVGIAFLGAGIGALALGIAQGPDWGWHSAQVVASLAAGAIAVTLALWRSTHHPTPAIDTRLWRTRSFAIANLASLLYGAALFPWLLVGVLFLTQVWDYSPLEAGLAMTPGAIVAALVALRAGPIVAKRGARTVVVAGALVLGVAGLLGTVALPATPSFLTYWLPVGVLIGIGTGAITTGVSTAAALSVAPQRFAAAIGLNQTGRQVGGALGVAVLAALLQGRTGSSSGLGPFPHVYLFCTLATLGVAGASLWLVPKGDA